MDRQPIVMDRRSIAWQGCADSEFVARVSEVLKLLGLEPEVVRGDNGQSLVVVGYVEGWNRAHDVWRAACLIQRHMLVRSTWYERREFSRLCCLFSNELLDVLTPDA